MTDRQRLKFIRKSLKLKQTEFGETLGLSQGGYSDIERGKNGIHSRLKLLLKEKHNINLAWLERGEGEMFGTEIEEPTDLIDFQNENENIEQLRIENEKLRNQISRLATENKLFQELVSSKDKAIEALESQLKQYMKH